MSTDALIHIADFSRVLKFLLGKGDEARVQSWLDGVLVGDHWIGWKRDANDRVRYELNEV